MGGPWGAIVLYAVVSVFFFKRNPYLSAYCAGALHDSVKPVTDYGCGDFSGFTWDVYSFSKVFGAVWIGIYWFFWFLEFLNP